MDNAVENFELRERPAQLKFAIAAAALAVVLDSLALLSLKEALGSGWVLLASFGVFRLIFVAFLLALAYNGRGWVRYACAILFVLGVGFLAKSMPAAFLDFWMILQLGLGLAAILLWSTASCHAWYRNPYKDAS